MDNLIKPAFQTKPYRPSEVIRCRDRFQQYVYIREKAFPIDAYTSQGDLIMIFEKNDKTKELYRRWRNREFQHEEENNGS